MVSPGQAIEPSAPPVPIRPLSPEDVAAVTRIDAHHTGVAKPDYWQRVFGDFLERAGEGVQVRLAADGEEGLCGYLLGEVRAFEFGSEPCGWIFAVGVDPGAEHRGVASALLQEACRRFQAAGVTTVRTMVRRNDVPVLAFFRSNGFAGGPYVQLELDVTEPL
ncbi:MAG TPA: N-acetyltransferase [Thermoanaerobaculia bacterium]|nr:N-acetyltransferase [Thermoanaerobaculia bacterium]